jgi:hypothetical protein
VAPEERIACATRRPLLGGAQQSRVVCAAQAAVGRDEHQCYVLHLAHLEQRMVELAGCAREIAEHLGDLGGIGPRRLRPALGAAQLGGGHHLHRLRDLLGVLHRPDAPAENAQGAHRSPRP